MLERRTEYTEIRLSLIHRIGTNVPYQVMVFSFCEQIADFDRTRVEAAPKDYASVTLLENLHRGSCEL